MYLLVLSFFNSIMAQAPAAGAPSSPSMLNTIFPFVLIFAIFYFLVIRPQQKQRKKHQEFVNNLKKGDEVITSSGIIGIVHSVSDKIITMEVSENVKIKMLRSMVSANAKQAVTENAKTN